MGLTSFWRSFLIFKILLIFFSFGIKSKPIANNAFSSADTVIANAGTDKLICVGSSTLLIATGGASYLWSPTVGLSNVNISSPIASPIITTTYVVIASNIYGFYDTDTVVVTVNNSPQISSLLADNDTCSNGNASATVIAVGGTLPFSYLWNTIPAQVNSIANSLFGGNTYTVIVTDVNTCTVSQSIFINELPGPIINAYGISSTCSNSNGTGAVNVVGGNGVYSFLWNTAATSQSINNLLAGQYNVTVIDNFNCMVTDSFSIVDLSGPTAVIIPSNPTCEQNNGSLNLIVYGSNLPFSYLWSNGSTVQNQSNLSPGDYSVVVTDFYGCVYLVTDSIVNQSSPVLSGVMTNATCHSSNGAIDLTILGGTAPFIINWNSGSYSTEDLTSVSSGNYSVVVTDINGCSATAIFTIGDTPIPTLAFSIISSTCGDVNGSIDLIVTGGIAPYSYIWWNGETTEDINNFPAGSYGVTVIGSDGCLANTIVALNDLTAPDLIVSQIDNTCGFNNGSISLTVSGGTLPYTYGWSGGETTQNISGLAIGTYTVTVSDANGCLGFGNTILINNPGATLSSFPNSSTCGSANGELSLIVTAGTSPFTYLWNNGATTQNLNNVLSGIYNVTVIDANNCVSLLADTINNISGLSLVYTTENSTCGNNNGFIDIAVLGGSPPFSFDWNSGTYTTEDLINISSGIYNVIVTDQNGCTSNASATLDNINGPLLFTVYINSTCGNSNGSIDLSTSGGTAPFSYNWNAGQFFTEDVFNLPPDLYSVVVTDSNNCQVTLTQFVNNISAPIASSIITDATCTLGNGEISIAISGGIVPFVFIWSNGLTTQNIQNLTPGIYGTTITDANSCSTFISSIVSDVASPYLTFATTSASCENNNGSIDLTLINGTSPFNFLWNTGATTQDLDLLVAGIYSLTTTDGIGCSVVNSFNVNGSLLPQLSLSSSNANCNQSDGSIDLIVFGGVLPYDFLWSNNETTEDIDSVIAAYYSVIVTDSIGCFIIDSVFVGYTSGPIAIANVIQPSCSIATGSIDLSVVGGTVPYIFQWSNFATSEDLLLLAGGTYSVTVSDGSGCQTFGTFSLIGVSPINLSVTNVVPICLGGATIITASGASTYSWAPSFGLSTTSGANVLASPNVSMTYTVTGYDLVGCFDTVSVTLIVNPLVPISSSASAGTICYGDSALIVVTGGSSLIWSPVASLSFISMHSAYAVPTSLTTYTIIETSAFGCSSSTSVVIDVMPQYAITVSSPDTSLCAGESTTLISSGALLYTWSPSTGLNATTGSNVNATPTQTTKYFVTGINGDGCNTSDSIIIIVHPPVVINVNPFNPTICVGSSISLTVSGAVNYIWAPSAGLNTVIGSTIIATPSSSTTYTVTGTDSFGCNGYNAVIVAIGTSLSLYLNNSSPVICLGIPDSIVVSGSSSAIYSWTPSVNYLDALGLNVSVNPAVNTTYTLTAIDINGCSGFTTVAVTVNSPPIINSTNAQACLGTSTSLSVNGTLNYTWTPSVGLSGSTGNTQIAAPGFTTTYTIIGTDINGCADTTQSVFIVNPLPTLTTISSSTSICNGSSATITANGASIYQWTPTIGLSATSGSVVVAQPIGSTTYTIFGTNPAGCTNSVNTVIYVGAPVAIINTPIYPSICSGDSLMITLSGASTYLWTPSAGLNTSIGAIVVSTPISSTNYLVIGTDVNGCTGFTTIDITVNPNIVMNGASQSICFGQSVPLYSSGAYFYIWNSDLTLNSYYDSTVIASPLINTTYTLTGMNMYGCTDTALYSVNINPLPNVLLNGLDPFYCSNSILDTLMMNPQGGILFGPGILGNSFNPSLAGTGGPYYITYSYFDSLGCSNFDIDTTFVNGAALITSTTSSPVICYGSSAILSSFGGISYTWFPSTGLSSTSGAVVIASPSSTTTYIVTGIDANGCLGVDSVIVTVAPSIQFLIFVANDSICIGASTIISVSGALNYLWSPSIQSSNSDGSSIVVSPLINTTFTVIATDSNGCFKDTTVTVNVISHPIIIVNNPIVCAGDSALIIAQGATTYNWLPILLTGDAVMVQPLVTTSYTVIGFANSCTDTTVAIVSVLSSPVLSVNSDTICSGAQALLFANGASNYTWLPGGMAGNSIFVSPLTNTTYTLIGNNSSCWDTINTIVVVNPIPGVSFSGLQLNYCPSSNPDTLLGNPIGGIFNGVGVVGNIFYPNLVSGSSSTITYSYSDINSCLASDTQTTILNGAVLLNVNPTISTMCSFSTVSITASGATNYFWSPSIGLNVTTGSTVIASPSISTTYTVTGGNTNGCSAQATSIVNIGSNIIVNISASNDSICLGQTVLLSAFGGTTYSWSPAINLSSTSGSIITAQPLVNITYTVTGSNVSGCSGQAIIPITILPSPIVTVTADTICSGEFASLVASGAMDYQWSTNDLGNAISVNPTMTTSYTVIGINSICSDTVSTLVTVNALPIISAISSGSFICNGGTVQVNASGAVTYIWSPSIGLNTITGATVTVSIAASTTYTLSGMDLNGCTNSQTIPIGVGLPVNINTNFSDTSICFGQSVLLYVNGASSYTWSPSIGLSDSTGATVIATPMVSTTYSVTGIDINGCTAISIIIVNVNSLPLVVASATSLSLCGSGSTMLMASGGINYFWSPSIGLSLTTGSVIQAQPNSSIVYTVTGTDTLGCSDNSSVNIFVYPDPVIVIVSTNPTLCLGASTLLSVTGSSIYTWSPSTNLNSTTSNSVIANPSITTTYIVSSIDSNGCSALSTTVVTVQSPIIISASAIDSTLCFGQSTVLSVTGSVNYDWSPSNGLSSTSGASVIANPIINTTYIVNGYDSFGCQSIATVAVFVYSFSSVVIPVVAPICAGDFATLIATGAVNYLWSTTMLGDSIIVNPLINTSYNVIGTDANGCTSNDTAQVVVYNAPIVSVTSNQINFCQGQTIFLTANGANSYEWYPSLGLSSTTGGIVSASPTSNTTYSVVGSNSNGCTDLSTIEIIVFQMPIANAGADVSLCEGNNILLNATGGNSYEWTPQVGLDNPYISNPIASPIISTTYIVNVGNQNGCFANDTITIGIHFKPLVDAGISQVVCYPDPVMLQGSSAMSYNWIPTSYLNDSSLQNPICTPLFDLTYALNVTDSFGCIASDTVSVKVLRPFIIQALDDISICRNEEAHLNANGGNNYQWIPSTGLDNSAVSNPIVFLSETTTYIVTSSDGICFSSSDTVVVTVNQLPVVYAGDDVDLLYGSTYQLYGFTNGATVEWFPADFLSCTNCINPFVSHLNMPMSYILTATDSLGCRAESEVHISLTCSEDLVYVPNAFTPNGDNKNDMFKIRTYGLNSIKSFRVFNRWGEMVFQTYNLSEGWDGKWNGQYCAPGVFVYSFEGTCANGQDVMKKGNVTLIR